MTQPSITTPIGVIATPEQVQLLPGTRATIVVSVTNTSSIVDQFSLSVDGLDSAWFTVTRTLVNIFPSAQDHLELEVHLPDDAAVAAGLRDVVLTIVGQSDPHNTALVHLSVEVLARGGLEIQLTPQRVTVGRRQAGRFAIAINNPGNAERLINLVVDDPVAALEVRIDPDQVSVPPAARTQAVLLARPRRRPLVSRQQSYPFSLSAFEVPRATAAGGQVPQLVAALPGEVVYAAPLAMLVPFSPALRRALLALAALAVGLALLIWLLGEPGRGSALVEQVPAAKPVVAAAEGALTLAKAATGAGPDSAAAQAPQIKRFELAAPGQDGRADYALVWEVDGADQVKVDGVTQPAPNTGSLRLDKLTNAEHTLEATKGGLSVNQSVGIVILRAPDIQHFAATPESIAPGQSARLEWTALRGDRASIGEETVEPAGGFLQVSPSTSTSYTLVVENELGRTQQTVELKVIAATPTSNP